jgi:hypothetical protein
MSVGVDPSAGSRQSYVEDCHVCCRPILIETILDQEGDVTVSARRENE